MTDGTPNYPKKIALTAWTVFLWIFRSPTLLTLMIGMGLGYYVGWGAGKASALPRAVRAETALRELQTEMAKAIEQAAVRQVEIRDEVRAQYEDQNIKMDALNLRLRDLRDGVRLCNATSVLPIPPTTPGANPEENSGQPRPADVVLQELAADLARRCDGNAVQLNALIDWINMTRGEP